MLFQYTVIGVKRNTQEVVIAKTFSSNKAFELLVDHRNDPNYYNVVVLVPVYDHLLFMFHKAVRFVYNDLIKRDNKP